MQFRYIADTYAWIAYFNKKKFKGIIEKEIVDTPTVVIAELMRTLVKKNVSTKVIENIMAYVSSKGLILPLTIEEAKKSGIIAQKESLPLFDAIVYSYVVEEKDRLLTGDEHFKNKKQVIFEKE
ncbi:MAG: PIN domain-containing protein [archaeon]